MRWGWLMTERTDLLPPAQRENPPDVAMQVASMMSDINMEFAHGRPEGACIPMSYVYAEILRKLGIPTRIAETAVEVKARGDARTAMTHSPDNSDFLGHCVVYLPTHKWFVDVSLHTQHSQVIANAMPSRFPLYVRFDHRKHKVATAKLERGSAKYTTFRLKGNFWPRAAFPWRGLDAFADAYVDEFRRHV